MAQVLPDAFGPEELVHMAELAETEER